jgi:NADPH-dependent curcumin reductase CurA
MTPMNRQVRLAARPTGLPKPEDWEHTTEPVPDPGEGEVLVRMELLSLDPAMRGWMNEGRSYVPPVQLGEVMRAEGIGRVVRSNHPNVAEGQPVRAVSGVQEYVTASGDRVEPVDESVAPLTSQLGAIGTAGLTAYFGLLDVGAAKEDDTVVVSGAAGAVGSVAGQIARIKGCRVVGIAGGEEKCRWLTDDLGFDVAVDYRAGALQGALRDATPDRIDVFFDNVGGEILEAGLGRLGRGARVVICGAISQYNAEGGIEDVHGPRNYLSLLVNRARMEGFVVFDFRRRYAEAARELAGWLHSGALVAREHVVDGTVDDFPDVLLKLFRGENTGKLLLRLAAS